MRSDTDQVETARPVSEIGGLRAKGIYCQPGCGGIKGFPPDAEPFPSAAAAEAAGLRACHCCRPYRNAPGACSTSEEIVSRGIWLILDGMLDGHTEAELAAQLSVSPRHLSRLFLEHAGVTPDGLARSARAHFARRLLDDTDLSMMDVAFAAGYTSLRQFNRACREIFQETPRALRARRRDPDRLVADGGILLRLPFNGPLDWDSTLAHLAERAIPGVESVDGDIYRRTLLCSGDAGVVELMPGDEKHLLLRAHLPHLDHLLKIVGRARHIANLDFPIAQAVASLARIPTVAALVEARPGLRPPGTWDPFETGIYSILAGRRLPCDAATAAGRIVERHGAAVSGLTQLGLSYTFPPAATLSNADLSGLGLGEVEREAVQTFARAAVMHETWCSRSMKLDDFVATVTAAGVGAQTAHYLALRMGEPDAWPVDNVSEVLESVAQQGRPWRALAATHLALAEGHRGSPRSAVSQDLVRCIASSPQ